MFYEFRRDPSAARRRDPHVPRRRDTPPESVFDMLANEIGHLGFGCLKVLAYGTSVLLLGANAAVNFLNLPVQLARIGIGSLQSRFAETTVVLDTVILGMSKAVAAGNRSSNGDARENRSRSNAERPRDGAEDEPDGDAGAESENDPRERAQRDAVRAHGPCNVCDEGPTLYHSTCSVCTYGMCLSCVLHIARASNGLVCCPQCRSVLTDRPR